MKPSAELYYIKMAEGFTSIVCIRTWYSLHARLRKLQGSAGNVPRTEGAVGAVKILTSTIP